MTQENVQGSLMTNALSAEEQLRKAQNARTNGYVGRTSEKVLRDMRTIIKQAGKADVDRHQLH